MAEATGGGLKGLACRLSRARPEELSITCALFGYNFLVISSYLILKAVRYSLFLDQLGPSRLPWAYIGTALFVGVAVWGYERLMDRLSRTGVVLVSWAVLAGALVAFRITFTLSGSVVVPALFYFFSAVYGVVAVTLVWSFTAEVFVPPQGRRLFGFLQTGAILGGMAGSVLTGLLATRMGTENLLLVSAGLCVACGAVGGALSQAHPRDHPPEGPVAEGEEDVLGKAQRGAGLVRQSAYLRGLVALLLGFQLVSTLFDYLFQSAVFVAFPGKDARTAFFGDFYLWVGFGGLLVQVCLTPRVHRLLGVGVALGVLPALSLLGAATFLVAPGLGTACALRGGFGVFDYSLDRATRELLYLPTTPAVKTRAKAFLDIFCFRLFRSFGGVLILLLGQGPGVSLEAAGALTFGCAAGWWTAARGLAREYVREVRAAALGERSPRPPPPDPRAGGGLWESVRELVDALGEPGEEVARQEVMARATRRFGGDLRAALEVVRDPRRRPQAQELLDSITPPGAPRLLVRLLDPMRPLEQRRALGARLQKLT